MIMACRTRIVVYNRFQLPRIGGGVSFTSSGLGVVGFKRVYYYKNRVDKWLINSVLLIVGKFTAL